MWFKKKKDKEVEDKQEVELLRILVEYIGEARRLKWTKEEIVNKFNEKHYPKVIINSAFLIADNLISVERRNKMVRKEEDEEEEEDDEELEEEPEQEEEEEVKPVKKKVPQPVQKEKVQEGPTIEQVLTNHEQRLQILEASLFRLRSI